MPYDKESFLAGVAAGRNMRSWPAFEGGTQENIFSFTIDTRLGSVTTDQYVLICSPSDDGIIIDWGDNSSPVFVPRTGAGGKLHNYAVPGIYTINILGLLRTPIRFTNSTIYIDGQLYYLDYYKRCLLSVNTPYPLDDSPDGVTLNLDIWFNYCTNLQRVCGKLFEGVKNKGYQQLQMSQLFNRCESLQSLPVDLFEGLPPLPYDTRTNSGISQVFAYCFSLEEIPEGIFDYDIFENCAVAASAFMWCSSLKTVPVNLFSRFYSCENFNTTFSSASSIISAVPELWISHPNAAHNACFRSCTNAANYNDIPNDWK